VSGPGVVEAAAQGPAASALPQSGRHYLIIGSFADRQRAERVAQAYAEYHAQVIPAMKGGRELSRVVLGPLDPTQVAALRGRSVPGYLTQPPPGTGLMVAKATGPSD
jgi:hypothetical protein